MLARELSGKQIGLPGIFYLLPTDPEHPRLIGGPITMITHKKNGNVRIRAGKNNVERELKAHYQVGELLNA